MTTPDSDATTATATADGGPAAGQVEDESPKLLGLAALALSAVGFLTLLRLADRRDRSPAKALGLFFATLLETLGGTVLGLTAAKRASDSEEPGMGLLLGSAAAVLGVITTVMNFNWMRTRRRL
jgi:hypothetical protein